MSGDVELLRVLRQARATHRDVELIVTDCLYACCARPASRRSGYPQTYRGTVALVDDLKLVLHSLALGSLNYHVIAALEHVEDVSLISG